MAMVCFREPGGKEAVGAALESHQADKLDSRVLLVKLIPEVLLHLVAAQVYEALAVPQCLARTPL